MSKFVSLGLCLLVSFGTVCGLRCHKCYREYKNRTCHTAENPCVAKPGESCFRQVIFAEGVVLYTSTGCALNCKQVNAGQVIHHVNHCCRHADLCNSPAG